MPLTVFLLLAIVLFLTIGPLVNWLTVSMPETSNYRPTHEDELSAAARAYFRPLVHGLRDEGFEVVANVTPNRAQALVSVVTINFVRRETGDMATVMYASTGANLVGFDTQFADGSRVVTLNQSHPSIWPTPPGERRMAVPRVSDPRVLYQIHRCRVQAYAPAGVPVDAPAPGEDIERMHRDHACQMQWLIKAGYYTPPYRGRHRTTLKGAAMTAWRLTPPFRWLVTWSERLRARAELRSLGFNAFTPVVATAQP